jgi:hypothetical protein
MGILDLKTNLKSLRYGKDRPFGGSSNQPYITRDIDVRDSEVGRTGGPDFLLRGGTLIPRRVANDVSRMTQMLFDFKSPNGPLFTAKQNVLSLTSNNFKAGFETLAIRKRQEGLSGIAKVTDAIGTFVSNNIGFDKNNVYNPLSTIGQTAGGFLGLHLYKQGLNPIEGPSKYLDFIIEGDEKQSRLLNLTGGKLITFDTNLYQYIGGPGSINGVGRTQVKRYENTNPDPAFLAKNPGYLGYSDLNLISNSKLDMGKGNTSIIDFRNFSIEEDPEVAFGEEPSIQSQLGLNNSKTFSSDYKTKNFETRVNLGNPGLKSRDRSDYRNTDNSLSPTNPEKGALDKINAYPIYKSSGVDVSKTQSGVLNDFVKFRIGIIQNDNPTQKVFIHFRALIDSFSDTYRSEWNSDRFMGRGENFYRYGGFDRSVSLSWTVAAQSKAELIPQYQKLNYLASTLAPDFSSTGYMRGNLVTLTIGGYLYEQPGILTNMTLDVPQESPWEIGLDSSAVKEMPHYVKVTGVNFIPIHEFVPRTQQNKYNGTDGWVSSYGRERYIALTRGIVDESGNGGNNNYGLIEGGQTDAPNYIPK